MPWWWLPRTSTASPSNACNRRSSQRLAQEGRVTGASHRNWASYGEGVELPAALPDWRRHLLADPQADNATLADRAGVTTATLWRRLDRLRDCYIHTASPDGRLVPFCAYNLTSQSGRSLYRQLQAVNER